ncbi:MAG: NrsF family protein [Geminicoccales bacterium]
MVTTPDLIDQLCAGLTPVRRLRPPLLRAGLWLLLAASIVVVLAAIQGIRPGLALLLQAPAFTAALAGSLLTGALAAVAAFELSLPDRSRLWLLLPAPALALWVATIGYGCLTDWVSLGPDGIRLGSTLECFATLLLVSLPPAAVLALMLRHTAWLHPTPAAMSGGLAVGGIAATAMSLLHDLDATVMVLVWTLGAAALIVALCGLLGRRIFARTLRRT